MPVDPIINLGTPIVQAWLAGVASRRQQDEQNRRGLESVLGFQRDARDFDYRQQQDAARQAQQDRAFGLDQQQFDLSRQRMTFDQANRTADDDRRVYDMDQRRQQEQAAQNAYGAQFPQIVQARGMSPDQMWDQAGNLAQEESTFRAAPSDVQERLLKPAMDTVRDQQVAAAAEAKALRKYQQDVDQIINDPELGDSDRDELLGQVRAMFYTRKSTLTKHFGNLPDPAQIQARLQGFGLNPDQVSQALPAVGLHQAGIGQEMAQGILGTKPKTSYTAGLRAMDDQISQEIAATDYMIKELERQEEANPGQSVANIDMLRQKRLNLLTKRVENARQMTQTVSGGVAGGGMPQPAPQAQQGNGATEQAIDRAWQELGPDADPAAVRARVAQLLQGIAP